MARCWNCGLPDVAGQCPRCGAPQDWPGARAGVPDRPPAPPLNTRGILPGGAATVPPVGVPPVQERLPPLSRAPLVGPGLPAAGGGEREPRRSGPLGWDDPDVYGPPSGLLRPPRGPSGPLPGPRSGQFMPPGAPMRRGSQPFLSASEAARPESLAAGSFSGSSGPLPGGAGGLPGARAYREEVPLASGPEVSSQEEGYGGGAFGEEGPVAKKQGGRDRQNQAYREEKLAQVYSPAFWEEEEPPQDEPLTVSGGFNALLGAVIGGLAGGVFWIVAVVLTGQQLPYLTVLVGLLGGLGARSALYETRPLLLGLFAALGSGAAFVLTQYGLLDYALAQAQVQNHLFTTWFPLALTDFPRVYWDYVTGLPDAVTRAMGQPGPHSLHPIGLLAAMAITWGMFLWRKSS